MAFKTSLLSIREKNSRQDIRQIGIINPVDTYITWKTLFPTVNPYTHNEQKIFMCVSNCKVTIICMLQLLEKLIRG